MVNNRVPRSLDIEKNENMNSYHNVKTDAMELINLMVEIVRAFVFQMNNGKVLC